MDFSNYRRVPVIWAEESAIFERKRRRKNEPLIGICGESKRVFTVGGTLEALIIQNILITDEGCEEAERCIDFDCPFNKTTFESFCRAKGFSPRSMKKMEPNFRKRETTDMNRCPDGGLNDFSDFFRGNERGGWLLRKRRPR